MSQDTFPTDALVKEEEDFVEDQPQESGKRKSLHHNSPNLERVLRKQTALHRQTPSTSDESSEQTSSSEEKSSSDDTESSGEDSEGEEDIPPPPVLRRQKAVHNEDKNNRAASKMFKYIQAKTQPFFNHMYV